MPKTLRARLRIRQGRRGRAVTLPEIVRYSRAIQPLAEHIGHWASGTGFQRGAKIIERDHKPPASHGGLQTPNGCSDGDANTDGDAGSGHTHKRGARSETRPAVYHRSAVGQSCRYSRVG